MEMVIPAMRKQGGGMILNISSRVSKNYYPMLAAYASTKYALNALSLTARAELAKDNIIVSVMHPKMTATGFGKNSVRTAPQPDFAARPGMEIDSPEAVAKKSPTSLNPRTPKQRCSAIAHQRITNLVRMYESVLPTHDGSAVAF